MKQLYLSLSLAVFLGTAASCGPSRPPPTAAPRPSAPLLLAPHWSPPWWNYNYPGFKPGFFPFGLVRTVTDVNGVKTFDYDWFGRILKITNPDKSTKNFTYSPTDAPTTVTETDADSNGTTTDTLKYTLVNRRAVTFVDTAKGQTITSTFDNDGHLLNQTVTNASGQVTYTNVRTWVDGNITVEKQTSNGAITENDYTPDSDIWNQLENDGLFFLGSPKLNPLKHQDIKDANGNITASVDFTYAYWSDGSITMHRSDGRSDVTFTFIYQW